MEKAVYPRTSNDPSEHVVSRHIPQTGKERHSLDLLTKSEVVDGTRVQGVGQVAGHSYRWRLIIESGVRSIAQVPDRFFDIEGRSYPIDWNSKVSVFNGEAPAYSNFKDAIIYKIGNGAEGEKPHPYIIFDAWMDNHGTEGADDVTLSLQEYLTQYDYNASTEGTLVEPQDDKGTKVDDDANAAHNVPYSNHEKETLPITDAKYLAIVVDNNDIYHAYVGKDDTITPDNTDKLNTSTDSKINWYAPQKAVNVTQFKGLDMWLRFSGINAMTYFILTKYEQDILSIIPSFREHPPIDEGKRFLVKVNNNGTVARTTIITGSNKTETVTAGGTVPEENRNTLDIPNYVSVEDSSLVGATIMEILKSENYDLTPGAKVSADTTVITEYDRNTEEMRKTEGKLWAYVNPRTMQPFDDDYWFHYNEPYYVKSLTIAPKGKAIKGNRITIKADQWPGMYMMVGETYIRSHDTGEDERMQIKIPLCKVRSDQTITLEAEGEPTTFNLNLEVARPRGGAMMEITAYEIATKMQKGENGCYYAVDGSSEVLSE